MKWFQVDSDTPDDPKIRAVIDRLGNNGLGMLFRLWCYVAAHGSKRPGLSVDSRGQKFDKSVLIAASGGSEREFLCLVDELVRNKHISKKRWMKSEVMFFPAMFKRADIYTKRRVRTHFAQTSKKVPVQDKTIQDKTLQEEETPLPPFGKGGRLTRHDLDQAQARRARVYGGCPHEPRCADYATCVRLLALDTKLAKES